MSLTSLIQTLAVAEYLNFRHAANALSVSQSTVSARIKMLEHDLGILLFERRHRGVRGALPQKDVSESSLCGVCGAVRKPVRRRAAPVRRPCGTAIFR
jgi:hypothetical protein